jgi:predicted DNA-binding transcriptional regulator AlpA
MRNVYLADYLGVSAMCLWRWQRDANLGFPQPTRINGISYTDREAVDTWMRSRIAKCENVP